MDLRLLLLGLVLATGANTLRAAETVQTQVGATATTTVRLTADEQTTARIWGLTPEEMQRASVLLKGPRGSFSVANISPIEALGIHARTPAERRHYAEMFAKAQHEDVERTLAFANEYAAAMKRIYGDEPVVDYSGVEKMQATAGQAQAARIPRSAYTPAPAPRAAARNPPQRGAP